MSDSAGRVLTPACIACGGDDDLMDRGMAPGMTYCRPCRARLAAEDSGRATRRLPKSDYRVRETLDGRRHLYRANGTYIASVEQRAFRGPWTLPSGRGLWMSLREAAEALDAPIAPARVQSPDAPPFVSTGCDCDAVDGDHASRCAIYVQLPLDCSGVVIP